MSDKTKRDQSELPLEILDRIDQICDRFERAWEQGGRPRIENYLEEIAEPYRAALLRDLLAAELDARRRRGEHPSPTDYVARSPGHSESLLDLFLAAEAIQPLEPRLDEQACLPAAGA